MTAAYVEDAVCISKKFGYRGYDEVIGAAWLAAQEADRRWHAGGGASRRTFFARCFERELLRDLPRRSVPLARCVELVDDDVMCEEACETSRDADADADADAARERLALLPPPARRVAEEVLAGATVAAIAKKMELSSRRVEQLIVAACAQLRAAPAAAQSELFAGDL